MDLGVPHWWGRRTKHPYKGVETGKPKRENPQRIISASCGFGGITNGIRARNRTMCQPSRCSPKGGEPEIGRCVSLLAVPRRVVDTRRCASKDTAPQRGVDLVAVPH